LQTDTLTKGKFKQYLLNSARISDITVLRKLPVLLTLRPISAIIKFYLVLVIVLHAEAPVHLSSSRWRLMQSRSACAVRYPSLGRCPSLRIDCVVDMALLRWRVCQSDNLPWPWAWSPTALFSHRSSGDARNSRPIVSLLATDRRQPPVDSRANSAAAYRWR